jgi:dihydropteroate synthase
MGSMSGDAVVWRIGPRLLECGARTLVMGVVNVTPDSFSDGGWFLDHEAAVRRGIDLADQGADLVDVGGESTRPGAAPVPVKEEVGRVVPVVKRLAALLDVPISIDTRRHQAAEEALAAGATIVNDVSAGSDPDMFHGVAEAGAGLVLMHMQGDPGTMQIDPHYDDVVTDVRAYLEERVAAAVAAGVSRESLAVDPGLGFGKTLQHNLALMRNIAEFGTLGRPVVVGPSRKSFIGNVLDDAPVGERLEGTAGAVAWLAGAGAHVVRVHDVREMVRVVRVVDAIAKAEA